MPRNIVGAAFLSLDGVIQGPGGPEEDRTGGFAHGGWVEPIADEGMGEAIDGLFATDFDLLLGRRTYEIFAGYWPFQPSDNPITIAFAKAHKYALSHAALTLDWDATTHLRDLDALARVKAGDGPDMVIQGSSTLYPQLLARGLLDRLILMIAPVTVGAGKRLFGDGTPPGTLKLLEQRSSSAGWIIATYAPAGELRTGTFETQPPTKHELVRRERIARGEW